MIVAKLMNGSVITCRAEDSLQAAAEKMWNHDIGCLPVVDGEGHVVGMVTDRDACMAAYIQGRTLSAIQVRSAMAPEVISCLPTDDLETVEATMKANQIRRLPVIDWDGSLVGLIALNDIARESARELAVNGAEVTAQGLAETLAGICAPRQMGQRTLAAE